MTFADLLTTLETRAALPASRLKDCKTSLRYLASALGHASLEETPVGAACQDPAAWTAALATHFQTLTAQGRVISAVTQRNTRNNLRVIFRTAETHGLLTAPLPPRLLTRGGRRVFQRQQEATAPYPSTYRNQVNRGYSLPQAEWSPEIAQGFREYQARCGLRIRAESFRSYGKLLETYLGYIAHVVGHTPVWADLFDVTQVSAFVRWHAARLQRSLSAHGRQVAIVIAAMASVLEHPHARALADFRNALKAPAPLHNKRTHWVSLSTLAAVADTCLAEGRLPLVKARKDSRFPGTQRACRFQCGLILKLLVWVPLRQRNVREMQLGKHLAKDPQTGRWHLAFRGDELKVGHRGAVVNTYEVDLSTYAPEWLPLLEEFLTVHRPKLPNATTSQVLFLTAGGNPHTQHSLYVALSKEVAMRTGQRFYPHLIRTIWATEYLQATQDFTTAATMLGDTLQTVMRAYYDVVNRDQHAKARAFLLGTALHTG